MVQSLVGVRIPLDIDGVGQRHLENVQEGFLLKTKDTLRRQYRLQKSIAAVEVVEVDQRKLPKTSVKKWCHHPSITKGLLSREEDRESLSN